MKTNKANYFNALTGFRFLAASLVFVFHNRKYWRHDIHPELLRLINEFHVGVALFFVLSGFLIAYSYGDAPLNSVKSFSKYYALRIIRIMPVYWLILAACYLDPTYHKFHFRPDTVFLFHAFSNKLNLYGIAQAWSLNVEMTFYLLAPFLFFLMRKNIAYLFGALALLFGTTVGAGEVWHLLNSNSHQYLYPLGFVVNSTFSGRALQFAGGMMLAFALRDQKYQFILNLRHKTTIGFLLTLLSTYSIGLFQKNIYSCGTETPAGMFIHAVILPIGIVIALAGLVTEETLTKKILSSKIMVLLGNASFAFYLIHISYVNTKIAKLIMLPDRNFVILWLVSILIYLTVEKPVYDRLRSWITK